MHISESNSEKIWIDHVQRVWPEVTLLVAALALAIFGTTVYFQVGALSALPHASYVAYGAWAGACLLVGVAVAKHLFRHCSSSQLEPNNPILEKNIEDHVGSSAKERMEQKSHLKWDYIQYLLEREMQYADHPDNFIGPDNSKFSDLFLQYQNQNPEIAFVSRETRSCSSFKVSCDSEMRMLTEKLKAAFLDGKKMIFTILSTGGHAIAAGFSSDGSFMIVDSMLSHSVNLNNFEEMLNAAELKDATLKNIHFKGQFINTYIQKSGHQCLRFATLYCYHMAVRQDLTAFEEVNGAFLEGRLLSFEDYKKITGSPRIQSLKDTTCDCSSFMLSWAYRTFSLTINAWWELTLNELSHMQDHEFAAEMVSCHLTKSYVPKFYASLEFNLKICSSTCQRKKITPQTLDVLNAVATPDLNAPMEEALFKDNQSYLLVFIKGDPQPHLYSLEKREKVEYSDYCVGIDSQPF